MDEHVVQQIESCRDLQVMLRIWTRSNVVPTGQPSTFKDCSSMFLLFYRPTTLWNFEIKMPKHSRRQEQVSYKLISERSRPTAHKDNEWRVHLCDYTRAFSKKDGVTLNNATSVANCLSCCLQKRCILWSPLPKNEWKLGPYYQQKNLWQWLQLLEI